MSKISTIIAPATLVGESGIAILRISGDLSLSFLNKYFKSHNKSKEFTSHYLYLGHFLNNHNHVIDEIMAVYMQPSRSYTHEHVVELHCHGSIQILKEILSLAQSFGITLAKPGEFTYRAFINGRIDLAQAEAVSRLIQSQSEYSRKAAVKQLDGFLSKKIHQFVNNLKEQIVFLEAWIDFPDEDIPHQSILNIKNVVNNLLSEITLLTDSYQVGQIIHDGASVVLAGFPNSGKSSLLNALIKQDRAIVSHVPGTTRDLIEETVVLGGVNIRIADTAGLRETSDIVELQGVQRSFEKLDKADLILFLHDSTAPVTDEFINLINTYSDIDKILVLTKSDLNYFPTHAVDFFCGPICRVSAHSNTGLNELSSEVSSILFKDYVQNNESSIITERRHYEALLTARESLSRFFSNVDTFTLDVLVADLRLALSSLDQITGVVTNEAILDDIFSNFCIGK